MNSHIPPEQLREAALDGIVEPPNRIVPVATPIPNALIDLFQAIETLRAPERGFLLQFVAPHAGAGTTTIAAGFARAAALSYRRPILLIDAMPSSASAPTVPTFTGTAGLFRAAWPEMPAKPGVRGIVPMPANEISELLDVWRHSHHAVVLDCPALDVSSQAITLARYCDGTALVATAIHTAPRAMIAARDGIIRAGGQVLGAVFNRERSYLPGSKERRG